MDKNWNSKEWLLRFEEAKRCRNTRFERAGVFQSTLAIVREGRYVTENGLEVTLPLNTDSLKENVYCENEITIHKPERIYSGAVDVHLCDCLDFARTLLDEDPTDDVCVLNFASASTPGGGAYGGAGAQEEYLFRCSDYYRFLFQYASSFDPESNYGIKKNRCHSYPFKNDFTGIFSHGVTIFRSNESNGYALVDEPWHINFVAVAAHHLDERCDSIPEKYIGSTLDRIRTILRIAYNNGQRRLVLGAFGCGAFNNPPKHMAMLFKQVIEEKEFIGLFKEIHFAIIEDHNSHNMNYNEFNKVFSNENTNEFYNLLRGTGRDGVEKCLQMLKQRKFFILPASIKYQNPERGGLVTHSLLVCKEAMKLWKESKFKNKIPEESVVIASLLHDVCKTDVYHEDKTKPTGFDKHNPRFPIGHGERSIMMVLLSGMKLSEEECVAIRWHMGCHEIIEKDKLGRETEVFKNYKLGTTPEYHPLTNIIQKADCAATKIASKRSNKSR